MTKLTIDLPDRIMLRNYKGEAMYVSADTHIKPVAAKALEVGIRTMLTNVWNGGGKEATEAERHAAVMKKLDAWAKGDFNVVDRGESQYSAFREVFIADCIAAELTIKAAEEAIKVKVAERLGKDTKATFANFIEATAIEYAEAGEGTRDECRTAIEGYYSKEADRRATERAKAGAKIDLPKIDLKAFKK